MTRSDHGDDRLPRAELVHRLFRGSAELMKCYRAAGTLLEVLAAGGACAALVGDGDWLATSFWPLIAASLMLTALVFRMRADSTRAFSERCRRSSLEGFAHGRDVEPKTCSDLDADAPTGAAWIATKLPASSQAEYYEPSRPVGVERYREIHAHSSHFTWRLLRAASAVHWLIAIGLLAVTIGTLYALGVWQAPHEAKLSLLHFVATFVLTTLFGRAVHSAIASGRASTEIRRLHDQLILADASEIERLAHDHDIARASQPHVPLWAYLLLRKRAADTWSIARQQLAEP